MSAARLLVANWKMHGSRDAVTTWLDLVAPALSQESRLAALELQLALPFPLVGWYDTAPRPARIALAAQNCHEANAGAFTGEVSAAMLHECGVRSVIVGHSERRHMFGESDRRIAAKLRAVLEQGMAAILCVGETEQERDAARTELVLESQLRQGLALVPPTAWNQVSIAYEPVWAIGTGRVAELGQVESLHQFIAGTLASIRNGASEPRLRILYGGSVDPKNSAGLAGLRGVNGFLVGGASLDAAKFLAIGRALAQS
jgi:triosephosphate isomerase